MTKSEIIKKFRRILDTMPADMVYRFECHDALDHASVFQDERIPQMLGRTVTVSVVGETMVKIPAALPSTFGKLRPANPRPARAAPRPRQSARQ